jgi:hypothetical protein
MEILVQMHHPKVPESLRLKGECAVQRLEGRVDRVRRFRPSTPPETLAR